MTNSYQGLLDNIKKFRNTKVKRRKVDYILRGGKGRPRKTDFEILKVKDLIDHDLADRFQRGFETNILVKGHP